MAQEASFASRLSSILQLAPTTIANVGNPSHASTSLAEPSNASAGGDAISQVSAVVATCDVAAEAARALQETRDSEARALLVETQASLNQRGISVANALLHSR